MNNLSVGGYLKQLRKERRFSQEYVARRLGVIRQTYSTYETGRIFPPANMLVKIANLYEVSIDSFYAIGAEGIDKPKAREIVTPRFSATSILYNAANITIDAELLHLFHSVEERDQLDILNFLKLKARQYRNSQNI